ncbi:hypothetical protein D3C80_1218770 [compost metagenome]
MHAARECRCAHAVERRACAGTTAVEQQNLGTLAAIGRSLVALKRANADMQVPQRASTFRRHLARQHLVHGAEHGIGHQMAKHVANRNRSRMLRIQDAILRRDDAERQERIVVIWNIGCDRDLHAVACISCRIDDRAIDALRARRRGSVKIGENMIAFDIQTYRDIDR